jgi:hypothetical protein
LAFALSARDCDRRTSDAEINLMRMKDSLLVYGVATAFALGTMAGLAQTPAAPALDVRPAYMQIVTNYALKTNLVIVTNYVVVTNVTFTTNLYNAQGQLLMPVLPSQPPIPGLIPIPPAKTVAPTPDPAMVRSNQALAVKELLAQGLLATSNKLGVAGSFTSNATHQIPIPQGVTAFDRKKNQTLLTALNTAAETAVPETIGVILKTISQLKLDDPAPVIKGERDAATRQLLTAHGDDLANQVLPIVQRASAAAKVREAYNSVMLKGGGLLGAVLGAGPTEDMDTHITRGLMKAIFNRLAEEEGVLRTNPAARTTKVLQDAFKQ